jgi:hypothetical protein
MGGISPFTRYQQFLLYERNKHPLLGEEEKDEKRVFSKRVVMAATYL